MGTILANNQQKACRSVMVLFSGGIDSAACARFYQLEGFSVAGLFVDYGQISRRREWLAAQEIAEKLNLPLSRIEVLGLPSLGGKITGRNATLLMLGLLSFPFQFGLIAIGIHAGTPYEDCTPEFVEGIQGIVDLYASGRIVVGAPFINWSKGEIWNYALAHEVPINCTFSCERGVDAPCGTCPSCRDVQVLHACEDFTA